MDRDESPASPPPPFSPPPPDHHLSDVLVAEGGCLDSTVKEAPLLKAENCDCTTDCKDGMEPGDKNLEIEKSEAAEVRDFLWSWAENGYIEKELEAEVKTL